MATDNAAPNDALPARLFTREALQHLASEMVRVRNLKSLVLATQLGYDGLFYGYMVDELLIDGPSGERV